MKNISIAPLKMIASIFILLTFLFALVSHGSQLTWLPGEAAKVNPKVKEIEGEVHRADDGSSFLLTESGQLFLLLSSEKDILSKLEGAVRINGLLVERPSIVSPARLLQMSADERSALFQPAVLYPIIWVLSFEYLK
ncbi:MAG: hypothetical protein NZ480_07310 [Bdellovibrionaceae bacterium]|nr:hypothetical protein [Pseudobdellovibrionaceae bacterium]MDW8190251.1 hypothetical protein [Pseudobdellovibrionaceae bacterium]